MNMNVTQTSQFTSYCQWACLEINNTTLYSMHSDGYECCLALVNSNNFELLNKHELTYNGSGCCMCRIDDIHVVVG